MRGRHLSTARSILMARSPRLVQLAILVTLVLTAVVCGGWKWPLAGF
jgi:hypothetical protein